MPHADRAAHTYKVVFMLLVQHTRSMLPKDEHFPWETWSQALDNKGQERLSVSYQANHHGSTCTQTLARLEARDCMRLPGPALANMVRETMTTSSLRKPEPPSPALQQQRPRTASAKDCLTAGVF